MNAFNKTSDIQSLGKYIQIHLAILLVCTSLSATSGPREQAKAIHDRLVGVPPDAIILDSMAEKIVQGDSLSAAYEAMNNKLFYTVTLKNFVTPWTNETESVFEDLNDFSATVIGMIRDEIPFNQILSADMLYIGAADQVSIPYSHVDNLHYQELEEKQIDLSDPSKFFAISQSTILDSQITAEDASGVLTTRTFGEAFLSGGTNRAAVRIMAVNHLCRDMEDLLDITLTPDRIRQDVSRSPGGDSSIYLNSCIGCHSGMDPLTQAFAYYNFDSELNRVVHTPGQVQEKYLINANTFPQGYVTSDNRWDNYWRKGKNSVLGWRGAVSGGFGLKSLGQEITNSRRFSECQVEKVFENICFREPVSILDRQEVQRISSVFERGNYNMKQVFAEVAGFCTAQ